MVTTDACNNQGDARLSCHNRQLQFEYCVYGGCRKICANSAVDLNSDEEIKTTFDSCSCDFHQMRLSVTNPMTEVWQLLFAVSDHY